MGGYAFGPLLINATDYPIILVHVNCACPELAMPVLQWPWQSMTMVKLHVSLHLVVIPKALVDSRYKISANEMHT
jgi:hypothetical protein